MQNRKKRMKEAEVLTNIEGNTCSPVRGDVLITRNPCTHPGDLRRLKSVDCPQLKYLHNVIVFSSKGDRPPPNMMSGGDLDGDVYFITWDEELLGYVPHENLKEPADYSKN
mmetsp:Transcript_29111/g.43875  ORF Transcript_29111/g.43875 Transcript_29111/m.43875 type:complete len:111 (-) Transcript_29111:1382-1714(-)